VKLQPGFAPSPGFVVKWLFYIAIALALIWLIGSFFRGASSRWYRW
jgi:hypothetical protein